MVFGGRRISRRVGGGLMSRINLIVSGDFKVGDYDSALSAPYSGRVPTRCAFQFSATDGAEETFQVEYVMRMMADWAHGVRCDPYVKIQNTGVSVLLQGFFDPPPGAERAPISAERCNVVLATTESTGLTLSDIDRMKSAFGVDQRPFQACLSLNCFVRLPRVQLAFRFLGPSDPVRTMRLMDAANESYVADIAAAAAGRRASTASTSRKSASAATTTTAYDNKRQRAGSGWGRYGGRGGDFDSDRDEDDCYGDCGLKGRSDGFPPYDHNANVSSGYGRDRVNNNNNNKNKNAVAVSPSATVGGWLSALAGSLGSLFQQGTCETDATTTVPDGAASTTAKKRGGQRLMLHMGWTAFVTSAVTLAMWIALWCIKDGAYRS